jgi:hypothetical protein
MKLEEAIVVLNNLTNKDFIKLIKKYIDKKAIKKLVTCWRRYRTYKKCIWILR